MKTNKIFLLALSIVTLISCGSEKSNTIEESKPVLSAGNAETALEDSLNLVLRENPNDLEAYVQRGRLKFNQTKFQGALNDAKRALVLDTTDGDALLLAGEAFFSMDKFFESQQSFENCMTANPKFTPCLEKLAEINLLRKSYDKAMGYVNDALRIDEQNFYPYYLKGWIYQERGDSARAASSFQTAVELNPNFYDGYIMLGSLYYNENHPLCVQYFNTALEIVPSSTEAMYFLAMYYQNNGKANESISIYRRMMQLSPNDVRPWYNSGFVNLTQVENYDSAVFYFNRALNIDPEYHQAYYNRGLAYLEAGDKQNAKADFEKAVEINRDYTLAIKALNKMEGK